eukprot:g2490.t1
MEVTRTCAGCGLVKPKARFSKNQYKKGVGTSRCKECVLVGSAAAGGAASLAAGEPEEHGAAPPEKVEEGRTLSMSSASLGTSVGKGRTLSMSSASSSASSSSLGTSVGSALFDQLSSKGAAASSVSEGMSLAEFSASLAMADDLGLNSQGLEVGTDAWKRWVKALFARLDIDGDGRVSRQEFVRCFDDDSVVSGGAASTLEVPESVPQAPRGDHGRSKVDEESGSTKSNKALEEVKTDIVDPMRLRASHDVGEEGVSPITSEHQQLEPGRAAGEWEQEKPLPTQASSLDKLKAAATDRRDENLSQQSELEVARREIERLQTTMRTLTSESQAQIQLYKTEMNKIRSEATVARFKERVHAAIQSQIQENRALPVQQSREIIKLEGKIKNEQAARALLADKVEQYEKNMHAQNMELVKRDSQLGSLRAEVEELHDKYKQDISNLQAKYEQEMKLSNEKEKTDDELAETGIAVFNEAALEAVAVVENITESSSRQVGAEVDTQKEIEMRLSVVDLQDKLAMYRARLDTNKRQHDREMQQLKKKMAALTLENNTLKDRLQKVAQLAKMLPMMVRQAEISGEMVERNMASIHGRILERVAMHLAND